MSRLISGRWRALVAVLAVVVVLTLSVAIVQANVRTEFDGEAPAYARLGGYDTVDGAVFLTITFYRPPECVPEDFNLLTFYDYNALACGPPTTQGFLIWKNGPQEDPAPFKAHVEGRGSVPVWFVHLDAVFAAIDDGVLTIGELEAMPSLIKGTADYYMEELHPDDGLAKNGLIQQVARGQLEDGRAFQTAAGSPFLVTGQGDARGHATIVFK